MKSIPMPSFYHLLHPYNTSLVTCGDAKGEMNVIAIAWLVPLSVRPPMVGMSIGPKSHSYQLIQTTGEFVINVAPAEIAAQVLFCGRRSGRNVDKFNVTDLTPALARTVRPPIVTECIAHLECRVVQDLPIGNMRFVIAEVLAAYAPSGIVLEKDNLIDLSQVRSLLHLGLNRFATTAMDPIEPPLSQE